MGKKQNQNQSQKQQQDNKKSKQGGKQQKSQDFSKSEHLLQTNCRNLKEETIKFQNNYKEFKTYFDQIIDSLEGVQLCQAMKHLGEEIQEQGKIVGDLEMNNKLQIKLIKRSEKFWSECNKKIEELEDSHIIISQCYKEIAQNLSKLEGQDIYQQLVKESNTELKEQALNESAYIIAQDLKLCEQQNNHTQTIWKLVQHFQSKFTPLQENFDISDWKFYFQ